MKKIFLFIMLFVSINIIAAPYNGKILQFKQPDGSFVDLKLFGTEFYMRAEGLDGYTLIRDAKTNWICYAKLSENNNELISTGIIYKGKKDNGLTLRNDLNFPKHIDISNKSRAEIIAKNKKSVNLNEQLVLKNKTLVHHVIGNIKGLCIVVDFSDEQAVLPITEFDNFCNDLNYINFGNNGSLRKFYSDISGGLVDYQNVVYGYYRAPLTFAEYEQMPMGVGARQILELALNWIESTGFDFSTLTTNPDGSIEAINLMYTGVAQTWSQGMWYHQGYYGGFYADGVHSGAYNTSPANSPLELATVAHENGHMIGKWPDTYKYDGSDDGIGSFDLMCWMGDYYNPVPPNPHFWTNAGWGKVVDLTNYNGINNDTANTLTCYKYKNLNDTNEFFLIENFRQISRYASVPDEGLTIWHIDRSGDNQTSHNEVYLEHANNDITNHYDACFHFGLNVEFGETTTPNSNFYNGNPSGLRIWDIGNSGNIMTYKLGAGQAAPTFNLQYVNIANDNNANGFLEASESADVNVNASNFGQINSGNATVTCSAIGANAGFVTVNNPVANAGIINVSQTIPLAFNITISSLTSIGTVIDLKFLISDGTYSTYITKSIVIGVQILMTNQQVSTCSAMFYDDGGNFAIYNNSMNFVTTLLPASANNKIKVEFLSYDVEYEPSCGYDYLNIYDGNSTSSPLIGMYCGTNSPGIITSTDATGALTFSFHSDDFVTGNGWEAIVSCVNINEVKENENNNNVQIYPNPTSGIINLQVNENFTNISVTDVFGREVYKTINKNLIDISFLSNGIYFLKIKTNNEVLINKIVKK